MTTPLPEKHMAPTDTVVPFITSGMLEESLKDYVGRDLCTERRQNCQTLQTEKLARIDDRTTLQTKLMWALLSLMATSVLAGILQAIGVIK